MSKFETKSKELYDFFMQAPAPMAILQGPEHIFVLANKPYSRLAGKNILGMKVKDAFSDSIFQTLTVALDEVYRTGKPYIGKEIYFSTRSTRGKLKEYYINLSYTAYRSEQEGIKGVWAFAQDVTDQVLARKRLETEKEEEAKVQEALLRAKEDAERASELKSAFLANMSHEIRTPLSAILGFTELMKHSESKEDKIRFAKVIERNGKALTTLIDDILDLSKVEAGMLKVENINFNIRDLVEEISGIFIENLKKKNIKYNIDFDPKLPLRIKSDPGRIRQILINLIGNAVKFTNRGRIDVKVETIFSNKVLTGLKFIIKDTGVGMTSEQASHLFEPFSQADNSMTRKFGGSGLGLALSRRLARALGGEVLILNCEVKKGSTFMTTIKTNEAPVSDNVQIRKKVEDTSSYVGHSPLNVLLVEDSLDNQLLFKIILDKAGMNVDLATNGSEGIRMAKAGSYDVVLMDMQMPILDGFTAIKHLRGHGFQAPIIGITAHGMVEDRRRILSLGCNAHLTKPVDSKSLVETIWKVLSQKKNSYLMALSTAPISKT